MQRKLLLLLRISKPEYNKTLYQDYKIFMNAQRNFRNPKYNNGQYDKYEGAILQGPCAFVYHVGKEERRVDLDQNGIIYKENNAYVFCMYEVEFDKTTYDSKINKYYHNISWDYIKHLWDDEGLEMLIIKNTTRFLEKFHIAAERENKSHAKGLVKYDLQDKLQSKEYFEQALRDDFEAVYHKVETYKEQNEYRLTILNGQENSSYILPLEKDNSLLFDIFSLEYGKNIVVEVSNLEFNSKTGLPDKFSSKLSFYEPVKPLENLSK